MTIHLYLSLPRVIEGIKGKLFKGVKSYLALRPISSFLVGHVKNNETTQWGFWSKKLPCQKSMFPTLRILARYDWIGPWQFYPPKLDGAFGHFRTSDVLSMGVPSSLEPLFFNLPLYQDK